MRLLWAPAFRPTGGLGLKCRYWGQTQGSFMGKNIQLWEHFRRLGSVVATAPRDFVKTNKGLDQPEVYITEVACFLLGD